MAPANLGRRTHERLCAIGHRRHTEVTTECAREDFVTVEACLDCDVQHRVVARHQPRRSLLQLQTKRVPLRRLVNHRAECAMKVKRRPPRARSKPGERRPISGVMTDLADNIQ